LSQERAPGARPIADLILKRVLPAVLGLFVVGLVVLMAAGPSTQACLGCHNRSGTGTASAHKAVGCEDCHAATAPDWIGMRIQEAIAMPIAKVTGSRIGTPGRPVADVGCQQCHREDIRNKTVDDNGLAINHSTCVRPYVRCVDCHGDVGHDKSTSPRRTTHMADCMVCHNDRTASARCETCHVGKRPEDVYKKGPWAAVHLDRNGTSHGLGQLDSCNSCHPARECSRCHGIPLPHDPTWPRTHGYSAKTAPKSCVGCHDKQACIDCHRLPMPHPAGFLRGHGGKARSQNDPICMRCHESRDCEKCHAKHTHPAAADGYKGPDYW
jgi:hypothetical protein